MVKYLINEFLELRLEDGITKIYVNNELFIQCKYLLVNISINESEDYKDINSIDEVIEKLDQSFDYSNTKRESIPSEVQFWGHCSNLQGWFENNYDSSLLHSNLAFPLLKELVKAGDVLANRAFKEEIVRRFDCGYLSTVRFLLYNGYLNFLDKEELDYLFAQSSFTIIQNILKELISLMISPLVNYKAINELIDLVLFVDLKYNQYFLIDIWKNLPPTWIVNFTKSTILHLNYKEFKDYQIPYGKFFLYFETILNFLYTNYSHCRELLKILDTGFYISPFSIEEQLTNGTALYE